MAPGGRLAGNGVTCWYGGVKKSYPPFSAKIYLDQESNLPTVLVRIDCWESQKRQQRADGLDANLPGGRSRQHDSMARAKPAFSRFQEESFG
jgi:hypothetical protein